jgi:putative endonuclease
VAAKDELGRQGETLAVEHLENAGLTVLHRNWRCAEGELDIVATWLSENRVKAYPTLRFDVIGVLWLPGEPPRIEHRAQAF